MAAERTPSTKPEAEKTADAGASAMQGGGFKAWLPLVVAAAVMPLLAYGMTTWVIVPKLEKSLGLAGSHSESSVESSAGGETASAKEASSSSDQSPAADKQTVTMNKVLVNVAGTMGSRYLLTSFVLAGTGKDFQGQVEKNEPQLRDVAGSTLSTKTIADLGKPDARNLIRSELISSFNSVLGNGTVKDLYFTEFAIQ